MPNGQPAPASIDKTMLQMMWALQLQEENSASRPELIIAGIGKPSFPINAVAAQTARQYWEYTYQKSDQARRLLEQAPQAEETRNRLAKSYTAVGYGDPRGDHEARLRMSQALSQWYGSHLGISPEHILFTVGGAAALHNIFGVINNRFPGGFILTGFPRYGLYQGPGRKNKLFPIPVMQEPGYRLTAALLESSLSEAKQHAKNQGTVVSAVLICDPYNPLGSFLAEEELRRIAAVLRLHPEIFIILDEAYTEMRFSGNPRLSLLSIAPDLKHRIIVMRTATKMLSAAGERMAILLAFDQNLMNELIQRNIELCGHAPRSLQFAFAEALATLDDKELGYIRDYYQPQVRLVERRLKEIGAAMPDPKYLVEATFYVLADLSEMLGTPLPPEAERALNRKGLIHSDVDLAYALMFQDGIMITPLSFCDTPAHQGYFRITCCGGDQELRELMLRLENRLTASRLTKHSKISPPLIPSP